MKIILKLTLGFLVLIPFNTFAQVESLEPVVIVPGIVGSWNADVILKNKVGEGEWKFLSIDKTWDKMILELEDAGYEIGENLIIAFYDWRKNNIDSANNYLIPAIDKALENSPTGKVNILAHSMGGLVARAYIQSGDYRGDVNKLIMLGTPNLGSADIYVIWAGGEIPGGWSTLQRTLAGRYIDFLGISNTGVSGDVETVRTFIPSVGELLQIYDFLQDSEGNLKSYHDLTDTKNHFLEDLRGGAESLTNLGGIITIAGTSSPTIATIPVVAKNFLDGDKWTDGKPQPLKPVPNSTEGDNRVMSWSATLNQWDIEPQLSLNPNIFQKLFAWFAPKVHAYPDWGTFLITKEVSSDHGSLPTLTIRDVFDALSLNPESIPSYAPLAEPDNIVSFWFASPVIVKVTDPQGRVITKDSNDIPGAAYTGETDPNGVKLVLIENGLSGEYKIELTGTGDGEYHILSSVTADEFDEVTITQDNITRDEVHEYTVKMSTTEPLAPEISEPVITPPDPSPNEDICSLDDMLTRLRDRIVSSNLNSKAKNNLMKRLERFEERLDKQGADREKLCEIFGRHTEKRDRQGKLKNISEHDFSSLFDEFESYSGRKKEILGGAKNFLNNIFGR